MKCLHIHDSAVYVLGALSPAERADYERHLSQCPACRADVAELAVLPGLLGRVDERVAEGVGDLPLGPPVAVPTAPSQQDWPELSPDGLPTLLAAAKRSRARERRIRRWRNAATVLVAACIAVFATIGVSTIVARPPGPALEAMRSTGSGIPMSAELALRPVGNRTEIRMHCFYDTTPTRSAGSARYTFKLFAVPKAGGEDRQLGLWDASFGDDMNFMTTVDVPLRDMERVELRRNDGKSVILTYDVK